MNSFYYNLSFDDYLRNLYCDISEVIFSISIANLSYAINSLASNKIHIVTKAIIGSTMLMVGFLIYHRISTEVINNELMHVEVLIINKTDPAYTDICDPDVLKECNSNIQSICKMKLNTSHRIIYNGLTYVLNISTANGFCNLKTFTVIIDDKFGYWQQMPDLSAFVGNK